MPTICPNCSRVLTESDHPEDPPIFCMYCGHRLRATVALHNSPIDTIDYLSQQHIIAAGGARPEYEPRSDTPPDRVGGLRLVRFLGAGGMGSVYEAQSDDSGERVAVKLLSPKLAANRVSVERFRQEGRLASQINHPRCVFVLRADADAGWPFIVMELMPGKTLKDVVDLHGPMATADAIARILDVIDGLAEAHRLGVIHRDVKPSNCFLTSDDRVKIGDFGLSKSLSPEAAAISADSPNSGDAQLTQSGAFLGTILYAAPEQIRGEPVGYETDVYAVCATLYFLLTGRAPHQHESATAAVAKAISEPVRSTRDFEPRVPAELDRVVLSGLDRNRDRRWQTLEELRDALQSLLPANQRPARPRSMILAYMIDVAILQIPSLLLDLAVHRQMNWPLWTSGLMVTPADALVAFLYFGPLDGLLGWTAGKRLVGIRVSRLRETGPPGFAAGFLRTIVFHVILFSTLIGIGWVIGLPVAAAPVRIVGMILVLTCGFALAFQLRPSKFGNLGIHDRLTRCRTVQRTRRVQRTRLVSRFPNPLDRIQPTVTPAPDEIGAFQIHGKLCDLTDGGEVWLGEDRGLARRVLIRILPIGAEVQGIGSSLFRPTRMRPVGNGTLSRADGEHAWVAYVAPSGAPLVDVVDPERPLIWADARSVLEQVVEELEAGGRDPSREPPSYLTPIWVEPSGRVQILDFVIAPSSRAFTTEPQETRLAEADTPVPLGLIRQVASLTLEGRPRTTGDRVQAPVPPHAAGVMTRLFQDGSTGYRSLGELRHELEETHNHPAQVTASMRAAQIGAQGMMMAIGFLAMLLVVGLFTFGSAVYAAAQVWGPREVRDALANPSTRIEAVNRLRQLPASDPLRTRLEPLFTPDAGDAPIRKLDTLLESRQENLDRTRSYLTRIENHWLTRLEQVIAEDRPEVGGSEFRENAVIYLKMAESRGEKGPVDVRPGAAFAGAVLVAVVPMIWAGFAFVFRGGLSMLLAGITLVRRDGRLASRWRCAVRELLIWLPLMGLLWLCLWVQFVTPEYRYLRVTLWIAAVILLPLYALIAVRNPERGPQDRILGTYLVPV